ncbi:TrbI/VirB10 family protein [Paraburkholderia sp. HD33-4]|uniref:TrbI/VirB10 family protein n=1 Tax=Paraburkholderia sp. HD33-4 TaxID=2883242 RepID=UPI001F1B32E6|nr:TrbI/VirB10 family protein [Paraburkholderia sp. HD33-4]
MKEHNEISNGSSPDVGTQPSLELPGRRKTRAGKMRIALVALAMIALGASALTIYLQRVFQQHEESKAADLRKPKDSGISDTGTDIESQKDRIKRDEAAQAKAASDAAAAALAASVARAALAQPSGAVSQAGTGQVASNQAQPLTPAERRLSGGVLALVNERGVGGTDDAGGGGSLDASGRSDQASARNTGGDNQGLASMARSMGQSALRGQSGAGSTPRAETVDANGNSLEKSLQPSKLQPMQASFRPNRHYLISRNTMIRCGQATAIRTDRPGLIGCPIAQDVWSDDGTTLLVRKGAIAKGETRDAVMQGQGVIGAIWDEIDDGDVHIPLNSPATDTLGAAGIPAYVDEHFWLRFKGALTVSLIGDFGQALANKATGAGQTITFTNSSNATQEVAAETLRSTINIPPTAYSNQGSLINIFVARDIDLRSVYENVGLDGNEVGNTRRQ